MKRTILAVVVAVAAAGTGVGAALFSAGHHESLSASHPSTAPKAVASAPQVLHFLSKDSSAKYVDSKPTGLSAGDVLAQHSVWYQHGANVGQMALTATVTLRRTSETGEVMFTAVAALEKGNLVLTGRFDVVPQNQTFQAAVTGGTGIYATARGYAVFKQISGSATRISLYLAS